MKFNTLILVSTLLQGALFADVVVKAKYTSAAKTLDSTVYTGAQRQRLEYGDSKLIRQCDRNRMLQLDEKTKTYTVLPLAAAPAAAPCDTKPAAQDTGEKKKLLGLPASHVKTTVASCGPKPSSTVMDAWYVSFDHPGACSAAADSAGFPLQYSVTANDEKGNPIVSSYEVVSLQVTATPLEAALFEPPADFKELTFDQAAAVQSPAFQEAVAKSKESGKTRIGYASVNNKTGQPISVHAIDAKVASHFKDPRFELIPLGGGTPEQVAARATESKVDYILTSELTSLSKNEAASVGKTLGKLSRLTSGGPAKDSYDAALQFQLLPAGGGQPVLSSSITGTSSAFGLKEAMGVAQLAGGLMMGGFMPGMGMFGGGLMMPGIFGGLGQVGMGNMLNMASRMAMPQAGGFGYAMDPGTMALHSAFAASNALAGPQMNAGQEAAVVSALDKVSKAVIAQLQPTAEPVKATAKKKK